MIMMINTFILNNNFKHQKTPKECLTELEPSTRRFKVLNYQSLILKGIYGLCSSVLSIDWHTIMNMPMKKITKYLQV